MRFQIEMTKEEANELNNLMESLKANGIKTKKELVNNALALLDWAINERRAGHIIASIDEKKQRYKEVVMPVFPRIN